MRLIIALSAILLAVSPMAAQAGTPAAAPAQAQTGRASFERGLAALRAHNLDEAVSAFTDAIRARENLADAYYNRGLAYFGLEQFAPAVGDFRASLSIRDDYDSRTFLGSSLDSLGQFDEALVQYRAAIALQPEGFQAWHELGIAYLNHHDNQPALDAFQHALRIQPDNARALTYSGDAYARLHRDNEALSAYTAALRIDPNDVRALMGRGDIYYNRNDFQLSLAPYLAATRADPRSVPAFTYLGDAYRRLDRRTEARAAYDAALRIEPNNALALEGLARLLADQGDTAGARARIEQLRRVDAAAATRLSSDLFPAR